MDPRNTRPVRSAVSLGLGAALLVTSGVAVAAPAVSALAAPSTVAPSAARILTAAHATTVHATVVRASSRAALTGPDKNPLAGDCVTVPDADPAPASTSCELWARQGSVTVNGSALAVWKFAKDAADVAPTPLSPAPVGAGSAVLVGAVGVEMTITIHNELPVAQAVGLSIPQLDDVHFGTSTVAPHSTDSFTFTPQRAGTYVYQAGLNADGSRQVAMGLVGALIVRPTPGTPSTGISPTSAGPYDDAETVVNDEALIVYTDIDHNLAANPTGFSMRDYKPDYHLVNGLAYPQTPDIFTNHGHSLLLRVVNGSILEKSPTILGTRMAVFAKGSRPLPATLNVSGRLIATGDTLDATLTMPATDSRYAIYDTPGVLRNGTERTIVTAPGITPVVYSSPNTPAMGGALTFIDNGGTGVRPTGPLVSGFAAAGQPGNSTRPLVMSANFDTAKGGGGDVTSAELYVDSLTPSPTNPVTITGFDATGPNVNGSWTLSGAAFDGLTSGLHTMWVRGEASNSVWGPYSSIKVRIDKDGPAVTGLVLSDSHVNGQLVQMHNGAPVVDATSGLTIAVPESLDISATLDERDTGGGRAGGPSAVLGSGNTGARYWVNDSATDPAVGTFAKVDLSTNGPRSVASVDGTMTKEQIAGLDEGAHTLWVQGRDDLGQWGTPVGTALVVDRHAPVTTQVLLNPNGTNGLVGSPNKPGYITVTATVADPVSGGVSSAVTTVEGYVTSVKDTGTANSLYFSPLGGGRWAADMPLAWVAAVRKTDGPIPIVVVGTDAAGNRSDGSLASETNQLLLDRVKPVVVSASASQGTTYPSNRFVTVDVSLTDDASGISYAEFFTGADPGLGKAARLTITPTPGPLGPLAATGTGTFDLVRANILTPRNLVFTVRTKDVAGNWATAVTTSVLRTSAVRVLFINGFEPNQLGSASWTGGSTGAVQLANGGGGPRPIAGTQSLSVAGNRAGYYRSSVPTPVTPVLPGPVTVLETRFSMATGTSRTGCVSRTGPCVVRGVTVLSAADTAGTTAFQVEYRRATRTSVQQFRIVMATAGGLRSTSWRTVPGAPRFDLVVDWSSATNGSLTLRVNGVSRGAIIGLDTSASTVSRFALGIVTSAANANGRFLFDTVFLA